MQSARFFSLALRHAGIARILNAALGAVEPGKLIQDSLIHLANAPGELFALGLGKAAEPMLMALSKHKKLNDALVITKHTTGDLPVWIKCLLAGHPIPDERSLLAGKAALDFASKVGVSDTLICLISGGGSALVCVPVNSLKLEEYQTITSALIRSGAGISEINIIRRALDEIKGGGLARACPGNVIGLILSDVLGNSLEAIASGPTVTNPTNNQDALRIIRNYSIPVPNHIMDYLSHEPPRWGVDRVDPAKNLIIGDLNTAAEAALDQAQREGFATQVLNLSLHGEASTVGTDLAIQLKRSIRNISRPFCLIAGGETTVTVKGHGKGGRNQELALAAVTPLADISRILFITLATDGEDGPTNAAGAVVTGDSLQRARRLGMLPDDYLARNDSYAFFNQLDDLLRPGPTGTNVNDLAFLFGL